MVCTQRGLLRLGLVLVMLAPGAVRSPAGTSLSTKDYGGLPLSFAACRQGSACYTARGQGYMISVYGAEFALGLRPSKDSHRRPIVVRFVGGSSPAPTPEVELPGKVNYIIGKDRKKWELGLPTFQRVRYRNVYPGIDVIYYGNRQNLEFDFEIRPGGNPHSIRLQLDGDTKLRRDDSGAIVLTTAGGDLRLNPPAVYQQIDGRRTAIQGVYQTSSRGEIAFSLGRFDRTKQLTIDPTIVYSTFLGGGTESTYPQAIAVNANNAFITGYTYASDFPVVSAAFAGYRNGVDGFVTKLNAAGTALDYSTYLGGSNDDSFYGIAVDSSGAAWVVGYSDSPDFPTMNAYQATLAGSFDVVVAKLSASGALLFATYLGGANYDYGSGIALDSSGNAYITGYTSTGFPTTAGVIAASNQGGTDAFVAKFSVGGSLVYSTYLGGAATDEGFAIAADAAGNAYVAGLTFSNLGFHGAPGGGAQAAYVNNGDAYVVKLNPAASSILYFTYLGGGQLDQATSIAVDGSGNAFVAGQTSSMDFPATAGVLQTTLNGGTNGFVAELNAAGSAFIYKTYIGSNRSDSLHGLALDASGNAYLAGDTNGNLFPSVNALQPVFPGASAASLYETANSGGAWTAFDTGLRGTVNSLSPDLTAPDTLVASTDAGLFKTTNGGSSWSLQNPAGLVNLSRSPVSDSTIYGINGSSAYKSADGGTTFSLTGSTGLCCGTAAPVADPLSVNTAYVYYPSSNLGVVKTTNGGVTWNPANNGLPSLMVQSIVAASDGSLYAAVKASGIYKSTNQGASWTVASAGLPAGFSPKLIGASAADSTVLYAADSASIYKTANAGGSWAATASLPPNGPIATIGISPQDAQVIYASSAFSQVVYRSDDGGTSWTAAAAGLSNASPYQFVFSPSTGGQVFALVAVVTSSWLAKLNPTGTALAYATFLGGSSGSYFGTVATNGSGDAFVTGYTYSSDFPVSPGAYSDVYPGNGQAFLTRVSDSTSSCTFSVNPGNQLIYGSLQNAIYDVVAPGGCAWTAVSDQSWAAITSGASGSGTGSLVVQASANVGSSTRSANLTIAGQTIVFSQASSSCTYNLSSVSTISGAGGSTPIQLTTGTTCAWNLANDAPTALSASPTSGTGSATINLTVAANQNPNPRSLTLYIGNQQLIVNQSGQCAFSVTAPYPVSASAGTVMVPVSTGSGCTWTASSALPWATVTGLSGATGNGSVTFALVANPGPASRYGTVTVAGQAVGLRQASPFSAAPLTVTYDIDGNGYQDVLVYYSNSIGYEYSLLSSGTGLYNGVATSGINPGSQTFDTVLQADLNGDAKSDVLFYSSTSGTLKAGIGDGRGNFTFAPAIVISTGYTISRGDFNGDGKTDLLLYRQSDGATAIGLSKGDGTFTFIPQNFSPGFTSVVVGDFNGDGISDVIAYNNLTAPYNAYVLFGDGTGHFNSGSGLFFGAGFNLYTADLNVDGKTDIVLYRPSDGTTFVAISQGSSFTYQYHLFSPNFTAFRIGDVNGDGYPDLVLYNSSNANGYLLFGDGQGNFNSSTSLFFGPGMNFVELRDVNGDGKQDVVLFRTADGTSFTGLAGGGFGFQYTYNYFGPGRIVAK